MKLIDVVDDVVVFVLPPFCAILIRVKAVRGCSAAVSSSYIFVLFLLRITVPGTVTHKRKNVLIFLIRVVV